MGVLFLGGDSRQKYACDFLNKNNIAAVAHLNFSLNKEIIDKIRSSLIVVLPLPASRDGEHINMISQDSHKIRIVDIVDLISPNSILMGGMIDEEIKTHLEERQIKYIDYYDLEVFQIKNALLSAEGAIFYAKEKFDGIIHGAKIAILGFGRIGKMLAYLLHAQGAKITVCARRDTDCVWSKLVGFDGFKIKFSGNNSNVNLINNEYDIVFNTIPYWIMNEEFAKSRNKDTLIIDLASKPFGIDGELVDKYKLNYYKELGIPGRYAPKSAGEIIGLIIRNYLSAKGE